MFESLTGRLGAILDRLKKRGALAEADVEAALREVRVALLEADVALPVVKDFIARVKERAVGQEVLRSVTPGQMVIKIVHDALVDLLGAEPGEIALAGNPPSAILMVGLQGAGKTTTAAKIGHRLAEKERKKVLLASLDVYRPAAQQQLAVLGRQIGVATLTPVLGEMPLAIARRALDQARREGIDAVILDTAGRLHVDDEMMAEAAAVRRAVQPSEVLLVADAMTGQDAVNVARAFHERVGITGIVLTRADGDARGGAALSMRAVTGRPIKLLGVGEKMDALEAFDARRLAGRILGMGDIVGLVEKAAEVIEREDAEKMARKMMKGQFSLDDLAEQLGQISRMGSMREMMDMLPGAGRLRDQMAAANVDERTVVRQRAIILSMTRAERANPKLLNASRRRRIAAGSGTTVQDVNRLLKQYQQVSELMKKMGRAGKPGLLRGMLSRGGPPPFLPR